MPHAYINGFKSYDDGTIVRVYEGNSVGTGKSVLAWDGKPTTEGMVAFDVSRGLVGQALRLTAAGGESKYHETRLPVSRLGVFHTVQLEHDRVIFPDGPSRPAPPDSHVNAQGAIQTLHRNAKHQNYLMTAVFAIATVGSVFIGLAIDGISGLAVGAVLTIASLMLGNYASGFSRGI
jgi:hypothetical protein